MNLLLQIYNGDLDAFAKELAHIKTDTDPKIYEYLLILCFWFAVHLGDLAISQSLVERERKLKRLAAFALYNKSPRGLSRPSTPKERDQLVQQDSRIIRGKRARLTAQTASLRPTSRSAR